MRFCRGLPIVASFAAAVSGAGLPLHCDDWPDPPDRACAQPADDIVAVAPGASYVVSLACDDCPFSQWNEQTLKQERVHRNQVFDLRIELAEDKRAILLNGKTLFPLPTIPLPPKFRIGQLPSNVTNANLVHSLTCPDFFCERDTISPECSRWCLDIKHASFYADYLYTTEPTENHGVDKEAKAERYWEVAFDAIAETAGDEMRPQWIINNADHKMLWMLVAGTEVKKGAGTRGHVKAASDLFGPTGDRDKIYEYRIVDVRLPARAYTFPPRKVPSFWRKIGRFFGSDVWQVEDKRFVYHGDEWGYYGKKGTLRNAFGEFVHWRFWWLFWLVSGSILAGVVVLYSIYKLFFWIQEQRQLNKWDGMDDVWDRLRREPTADEHDALLNGGYRDDPDEPGSSRLSAYTDEPTASKPLPDKPLPDKPLPAVPLIDA